VGGLDDQPAGGVPGGIGVVDLCRAVDGVAQVAALGPGTDDLVVADQFHDGQVEPVDDVHPACRQRPAEALVESGCDADRLVGERLQGIGVLVGPHHAVCTAARRRVIVVYIRQWLVQIAMAPPLRTLSKHRGT